MSVFSYVRLSINVDLRECSIIDKTYIIKLINKKDEIYIIDKINKL